MPTRTDQDRRRFMADELHAPSDTAGNAELDLSFSSDAYVQRSFGWERLVHTSEAADLSRLNAGGPVLLDHQAQRIGVVVQGTARIDAASRKGRARVRFSRSDRAREVVQDIEDGIRKDVSFYYDPIESVRVGTAEDGQPKYDVTKWVAYEISIMDRPPADVSVGVGRGVATRGKPMDNETKPAGAEGATNDETTPPELVRVRERAARDERSRSQQILAMGRHFNLVDEAEDAVATGLPLDKFREVVLEAQGRATGAPTRPSPDHTRSYEREVGGWRSGKASSLSMGGSTGFPSFERSAGYLDMSRRELEGYSILRGLRSLLPGHHTGGGLELEASRELAKRLDRETDGLLVPADVLLAGRTDRQRGDRTRDVTAAGSTGWIGTSHLAASFVENLYNSSAVLPLATTLPGQVGDVQLPALTTSAAGYWISNDSLAAAITESSPGVTPISLSPKTCGTMMEITRRILLQGSPAAEMVLREDSSRVLAVALDTAALVGASGGDNPVGVAFSAGIGAADLATPTYANMVDLESEVAIDNALLPSAAYVMDSAVAGYLKQTFIDAGSGLRVLMDGKANDYPVRVTNSISNPGARRIFFGCWSQMLVAFWGAVEFRPDFSTHLANGGMRLGVYLDADIALRHVQSFALNNTITTPA